MICSVSHTVVGNSTEYIGSRLRGRIVAVKIVAGAATASWEIALTGETTEVPILTKTDMSASATTWLYPRALANKNTDGSAFTDATADIYVLNERIYCVITAAGTTASITVTVFYDSEE